MKEKNRTPLKDAERLASLSRLALSEEESAGLAADLADMVAFADALLATDVGNAYQRETKEPPSGVLRKDTVAPSLQRETLLAASPSVANGYITVPRILGEETENV